MPSPTSTSTLSPRTGLAIAAAVTGLTLAGGATLASALGWLQPSAPLAAAAEPASAAVVAAPDEASATIAAPPAVPAADGQPLEPRVILVPIAPERPALPQAEVSAPLVAAAAEPGAGGAQALLVEAPVFTAAGPATEVVSEPVLPQTHVDEAGNVWASYGSGDWVLIQPAPVPAAPPRTQAVARTRESDDHDKHEERSSRPRRERHDDDHDDD